MHKGRDLLMSFPDVHIIYWDHIYHFHDLCLPFLFSFSISMLGLLYCHADTLPSIVQDAFLPESWIFHLTWCSPGQSTFLYRHHIILLHSLVKLKFVYFWGMSILISKIAVMSYTPSSVFVIVHLLDDSHSDQRERISVCFNLHSSCY